MTYESQNETNEPRSGIADARTGIEIEAAA
jgi:hypothetical protein